jgi:hypothetical protein
MQRDIKKLSGIMNLDDSNEIIPSSHHKEARNGVFKGEESEFRFTAIRGNSKVNNASIVVNDCRMSGTASFVPNCALAGTIAFTPNCALEGYAILQVNFSISVSCSLNNGILLINGITGGGGVYEIGTQAYSSEANALAGTTFTAANSLTFNNMPDGTFWFVVRDKNNISNKLAKSAVIQCDGTSTECRNSVSVVINAVPTEVFYIDCCNAVKSIQYTTVGTYTINDCIKGGSISSPDSGLASFTYSATSCICPPPDPTANWVDQNYNVCIECVSYDVYKDINPNSETFGKYKVNNVVGTTTAPIESACNTDANYSENVGTYYRCSAGTTLADTVYNNTNPCFTGNQYKAGTITYASNPSNTIPDTEPILTDQGYYTCYNCVNRLVYKNTNACSPFYDYYYVNGDRLTTTAPPAGNCPNTANWVDLNFQTCYGCQELQVYQNQANCVENSYKYRIGGEGGVIVDTIPSNTLCNYAANWVLTGYSTCSSCVNYPVYRDTNGCSSTYNQYRVNNIVVGSTEPTRGDCITTANWQNEGARVCIDCTSYQPQKDINPCSSTYNNTRNVDGVYGAAPCNITTPSYTAYEGLYYYCSNGTVYSASVYSNTNPCYSGISTAQYRVDFGGGNYVYYGVGNNPVNSYPNTAPNWIVRPIEVYWECDGTTKYYQEIDINSCSPTAGQTRKGSLYATNSTDCGYVPVTCTSYEIYNPDMNYDIYYDYEQCGGSIVYDTLGPNMSIVVCSQNWPTAGGGVVTPLGSCSV